MDHNWFVVSLTLHLVHLLHHSNDGLWIGTLAIRIPVLYLKLNQLLSLARLYINIKLISLLIAEQRVYATIIIMHVF